MEHGPRTMNMSHTMRGAVTAAFVLLSGVVIAGQSGRAPLVRPLEPTSAPTTVTSEALSSLKRSGQGMIHGAAVDQNSTPMADATIRLRNLVSREIEKTSAANYLGEFTFVAKPEIPYVVEVADHAGQVLAVGNVVIAQAGGVAGAFVTVPVRLHALTLGDTAGSVMSAAASSGLTALDQGEDAAPTSPER
jgi:hypothetical protein